MGFSYTVSLQIWHPDANPQDIVTGIGLTPKRYWAVGDQRMTPKGAPLDGKCHESYCVFEIAKGDDGELARCLRDTLAELDERAAFISRLRETGGKASFFVSWSPGDRGEVFEIGLLADMVRIGIDLGIQPLF